MSYDSLNYIFFLSKLLFKVCRAGSGCGVRLGRDHLQQNQNTKKQPLDVPGGAMDKNPLANAGGTV